MSLLQKQVERGFNVVQTTSTGRLLDSAAALLGLCTEKTYDGEPAMKLEAAAADGTAEAWDLPVIQREGQEMLSGRALLTTAFDRMEAERAGDRQAVCDIAASFQYNVARGIARMAISAGEREGIRAIALSGGVAYNHAIRETIRREVISRGCRFVINPAYPLGDGGVSFGQCVWAGTILRGRP